MENTITTILWDIDNTLLDFDYSMRNAMKQCFETVGKNVTDEMIDCYARINDAYWKRLEQGEVSKKQLLTGRFADFFAEYGLFDIDVEKFRMEFQFRLGTVFAFRDDSYQVCRSLHKKVSQYVVTNGVADTQRNKLELSGLSMVMDGIFISEEVGSHKPDRAFFEYCLKQIPEKDRSRILIVGDSLTSDIKGGNAADIRTCWYNPDRKKIREGFHIDYEISDIRQIFDVIGLNK